MDSRGAPFGRHRACGGKSTGGSGASGIGRGVESGADKRQQVAREINRETERGRLRWRKTARGRDSGAWRRRGSER